MLLLRTMLFVPGNNMRMLHKAGTLDADAIIIDLEDAVPMEDKETARVFVREGIETVCKGGSMVFVRVNGLATGLAGQDLEESVCDGLDGIVLPKAESKKDILDIEAILEKIEKRKGLRVGSTTIVPILETAKGVLNAVEVASASPRVAGLSFGAVDFTRDLGVSLSKEGIELSYPRAHVALAARAAGIPAVDTVFIDIMDKEGLSRDSKAAKQLGFRGKLLIHPNQIQPVNEIFSPTQHEVEYCKRVVATFKEAQTRGAGAISLDGKMIDYANYRQAEDILATWDAIIKRKKTPTG
jgi:citrate lyase subunit beta/citryl-CoA lyase